MKKVLVLVSVFFISCNFSNKENKKLESVENKKVKLMSSIKYDIVNFIEESNYKIDSKKSGELADIIIRQKQKDSVMKISTLLGMIHVESRFKEKIKNKTTKAFGLMGIMPRTWNVYKDTCGVENKKSPSDNIKIGICVFSDMYFSRTSKQDPKVALVYYANGIKDARKFRDGKYEEINDDVKKYLTKIDSLNSRLSYLDNKWEMFKRL